VELILGKKRIRRTWSDDEKRMICRQARLPGVSTAQVARRYAMNANLIFKWLREPAWQPDIPEDGPEDCSTAFLPIEISTEPSGGPACVLEHSSNPSGRIEIVTAGGHRVSVEGFYDGDALARLLKGLVS
jgi:transposase